MSVKDRSVVIEFLSQNPEGDTPSVQEQRARLDSLAQFFPVPDGVEVEPASVGGIKGEWVRARRASREATLLYLHGGGYVIGSPASHRHLNAAISEAAGMSVFCPDYRLAPEHPFPAAVDDAVAAYRGLLDAGLPASKLFMAGDSAGGGLTIATLVALRDGKLPLPAAAVVLSPWTDLSASGESHTSRAARDPMIRQEALSGMAALYLAGADARTPLASPHFAKLSGLPPLLIQVGTEEVLFSDAMNLATQAEAAGVEVSFEAWGGMVHVWQVFHPILSEGRDAIARIGAFLAGRIA